MLWGCLLTVCIVVACVTEYHLYQPLVYKDVLPQESRVVTPTRAGLFCHSITLKSNRDFSAAVYRDSPQVNVGQVTRYTERAWGSVPLNGISYISFYLLRGSTLLATACPDTYFYPDMYFIRGKYNLDKIRFGSEDPAYYIDRQRQLYPCAGQRTNTFLYIIEDNDDYFLAYTPGQHISGGVTTDVSLNRTHFYEANSLRYDCRAEHKCEMPLAWDAEAAVVYNAPSSQRSQRSQAKVKVICNFRAPMYFLAFALPSIVLGLIITVIIWWNWNAARKIHQNSVQVQRSPKEKGSWQGQRQRSRLTLPSGHGPPGYEELVNDVPDRPAPPGTYAYI